MVRWISLTLQSAKLWRGCRGWIPLIIDRQVDRNGNKLKNNFSERDKAERDNELMDWERLCCKSAGKD